MATDACYSLAASFCCSFASFLASEETPSTDSMPSASAVIGDADYCFALTLEVRFDTHPLAIGITAADATQTLS